MPKVSIDTSLNTVQVVKSGNDLQKTMDKLGRSIEKTFDGRKASGLGDALKPLTQELAQNHDAGGRHCPRRSRHWRKPSLPPRTPAGSWRKALARQKPRLSKLPPSWKKRTPMPTRPPTRLKK